MLSKPNAQTLLSKFSIPFKSSYSLKKLAAAYLEHRDKLTIKDVVLFSRSIWSPTNMTLHYENLSSGLLEGHSWHGSMPSFLHRSLQDRVRECCRGDYSLKDLLNIGCDIMKQEYFIVATHDLCESAIIEYFEDIIPPAGGKSVTDFIFRSTPVDLKVSTYPDNWVDKAGSLTDDDKKSLVYDLYVGADVERMRKQADDCKNNWGLNRLYIMVKNQADWFSDPRKLVERVLSQLSQMHSPFCVNVNGFDISFFLVEV